MNLVLIAGIFSLIPFVYLIRILTDARQLRQRFRPRALAYSESAAAPDGRFSEVPYLGGNWSERTARTPADALAPSDAGREAGGPSQPS